MQTSPDSSQLSEKSHAPPSLFLVFVVRFAASPTLKKSLTSDNCPEVSINPLTALTVLSILHVYITFLTVVFLTCPQDLRIQFQTLRIKNSEDKVELNETRDWLSWSSVLSTASRLAQLHL